MAAERERESEKDTLNIEWHRMHPTLVENGVGERLALSKDISRAASKFETAYSVAHRAHRTPSVIMIQNIVTFICCQKEKFRISM